MVKDVISINGTDYELGAKAENVSYGSTNVKAALDALSQGGGGGTINVNEYNLVSKLDVEGTPSAYGTSATIVGYDAAFSKRSWLQRVKMYIYSPVVGSEVKFYLGVIDQRGWLLPRKVFTAYVTSLETGTDNRSVSVIDLSDMHIIAEEGEVLFFSPQKTGSTDATFAWSTSALISGVKCYYTTDIVSAVTESSSRAMLDIEVTAKGIDTIFALEDDVAQAREQIAENAAAIQRSGIIYDSVTGNPYRIVINNGVLGVKSLNYNSILVLSHSYCQHGRMGWWDCDDNRGMAATVVGNDYPSQLKRILGASSLEKENVADWERNYITESDFDFSSAWGVTDDYDAVVLFVGANIPGTLTANEVKAGYIAALTYIKSAAPTADIFVVSKSGGNIFNGAQAAANEMAIPFININNIGVGSQNHLLGDYYIGRDSAYYDIYITGVANHPADYGHWVMAKAIALGMGIDTSLDLTHSINLSQSSGGTLSVVNTLGVEDGVISIKCVADEGYEISGLSVTDGNGDTVTATQRTNDNGTWYTFIMPDSDVTVVPTWTNS